MYTTERQDGFALPMTLLALVVIGAIVTAGFYVSAQEEEVSISSDLAAEAYTVAEYGLEEALATWKNADMMEALQLTNASPSSPPSGQAQAGSKVLGTYILPVDSLGDRKYLIRSIGTASRGPRTTTAEVGALVRTTYGELPYQTALSVLGNVNISGQAAVTGNDACDGSNAVTGVLQPTGGPTVTVDGANAETIGSPAEDTDATLSADTLSKYGDVDLTDLIASADIIYTDHPLAEITGPSPSINAYGNCDTNDTDNWGDTIASNVCGTHYPIIYAENNLRLDGGGGGGQGQGILIVEGDLEMAGKMVFHGVVITKGDLTYSGTGNHVKGAAIVMGTTNTSLSGNSTIEYDHCAVDEAFNGGVRVWPLGARAWVDLGAQVPVP